MKTAIFNFKSQGTHLRFLFLFLFSFLLIFISSQKLIGQISDGNRLYKKVSEYQNLKLPEKINLFSYSRIINSASSDQIQSGLGINQAILNDLNSTKRDFLEIEIPLGDTDPIIIQLVLNENDPEFIRTVIKKHNTSKTVIKPAGLSYRGVVKGYPHSLVSITVFHDQIYGLISLNNIRSVLKPVKGFGFDHIFYEETRLHHNSNVRCGTIGGLEFPNISTNNLKLGVQNSSNNKVIKVRYECDFKMYEDFQAEQIDIANYMAAAHNQVATIYAISNINVELSEIAVWESTDFLANEFPYNDSINPAGNFNMLSTIVEEIGSDFFGDLSVFISTRTDIHPGFPSGLATKIGSLCNKYLSHCLVVIGDLWPEESNMAFPNYTDFIEIITHETGHLLGSPHTQWCGWENGPIDDCAPPENNLGQPCFPTPCCSTGPITDKGTIMSYCHLSNGIDFELGFGTEPGSLLLSIIETSECVTNSISLMPSGLNYDSEKIYWSQNGDASAYTLQYKLANAPCDYEGVWETAEECCETTQFIYDGVLVPGGEYMVRVSADNSPFTDPIIVNVPIDDCNTPPSDFATHSVSSQFAFFSWGGCTNNYNYMVRVKNMDSTNWVNLAHSTSNYKANYYVYNNQNASGLTFEWQVKRVIDPFWSQSNYFTFLIDSFVDLNLLYCSAFGDAADVYIDSLSFTMSYNLNNYSNTSGSSGSVGYQDYNDNPSSVNFGRLWHFLDEYRFNLYSSFAPNPSFFSAFIDFNKDGDFYDQYEDVIRAYGNTSVISPVSGLCPFPQVFKSGWTNLRIIHSAQSLESPIAPNQCGFIGVGEVEDYLVYLDGYLECECGLFSKNVKDESEVTSQNAFPNPARNIITLYNNHDPSIYANYKIIDINGKVQTIGTKSGSQFNFDISDLKSGIYILRIEIPNKNPYSTRFIKM